MAKVEIVFEKGKWLVKKGGVVLGKFGSEETAKTWLEENKK